MKKRRAEEERQRGGTVTRRQAREQEREDGDREEAAEEAPEEGPEEAPEEALEQEQNDDEEQDGEDVEEDEETRNGHKVGCRRMTFRRGKGKAEKMTWDQTKIRITYMVTTAVSCPCEDEQCRVKIRVGRFGDLGDGRRSCAHCRSSRSGEGFFHSRSDLRRHVETAKCMESRGWL